MMNTLTTALSLLPARVQQVWSHWYDSMGVWVENEFPRLILIILVAAILIRLMRAATQRLVNLSDKELPPGVRAQRLRTLAQVINGVSSFVILFVALIQALSRFGIDMRPLLASAGIAGLAIGFGAQTLVKDVINGFFILVENQYEIGDTIRISGVTGNVEDMNLRRTILRDADGTVHTVPNSEVRIVSNLTREWTSMTLHIPVAYQESSQKVIKLLTELGEEQRKDPRFAEAILADPQVLGIDHITGNEAVYLMVVKTTPGQQWGVSRDLRLRIKERFEKEGIRMPSPSRVVLADSGTPKPS